MSFVTLEKELAVTEDTEWGVGVVYQARGAGTRVSASVIPYDAQYSIKEVIDFLITDPANAYVKRSGDIMTGDLGLFNDAPAVSLFGSVPSAHDDVEAGYHFRSYQNFKLGAVKFNELEESCGLVVYDGTGSAFPVASLKLKKTGLAAASQTIPIDPEDLTSKQYTDGTFPKGAWSFDGTVLDIAITIT